MLQLRDRLSQLEKITNSDAINTASNPHKEAQTLARGVISLWKSEIATKPTKTVLFKQLTSLMTLLTTYAGDPPIAKQTAPLVYFNIAREKYFAENEAKPEYYAGSKFFVYSKHLIIMLYTQAFYFEETVFNLYKVCKSFRSLLIKNYGIIDRNSAKVPLREISEDGLSSYYLRQPRERYRYKLIMKESRARANITEMLGLFEAITK